MNVHNILTQLVPHINEHLQHINGGGCGWFAHTLSTLLADKGIKADIVLVRWSRYNSESVSRMITTMTCRDINAAYRKLFSSEYAGYCDPCFGHVGVRVGNIVYDCEGVLHVPVISEAIEPEVLMMALVNDSNWNPSFIDYNEDVDGGAVYALKRFLTGAIAQVTT